MKRVFVALGVTIGAALLGVAREYTLLNRLTTKGKPPAKGLYYD
jgi:hypothetical protein